MKEGQCSLVKLRQPQKPGSSQNPMNQNYPFLCSFSRINPNTSKKNQYPCTTNRENPLKTEHTKLYLEKPFSTSSSNAPDGLPTGWHFKLWQEISSRCELNTPALENFVRFGLKAIQTRCSSCSWIPVNRFLQEVFSFRQQSLSPYSFIPVHGKFMVRSSSFVIQWILVYRGHISLPFCPHLTADVSSPSSHDWHSTTCCRLS